MSRTGLLAALTMMIASSPSLAQMGGMGGGMGGMGGGNRGAVVGMVMQQGGGSVGPGFTEIVRTAQVEMEGGHHLCGKIDLRNVVVDGELGQYVIEPEKIKMIRFLKPANEAEGNVQGQGGGDDQAVQRARNRAAMGRPGRANGAAGEVVNDAK